MEIITQYQFLSVKNIFCGLTQLTVFGTIFIDDLIINNQIKLIMEKKNTKAGNVVHTKTEPGKKETGSKEHKVKPDEYGSGHDEKRGNYRSGKEMDKKEHDPSSRNTSESHTHRSGQKKSEGNDGKDDRDSFHEPTV